MKKIQTKHSKADNSLVSHKKADLFVKNSRNKSNNSNYEPVSSLEEKYRCLHVSDAMDYRNEIPHYPSVHSTIRSHPLFKSPGAHDKNPLFREDPAHRGVSQRSINEGICIFGASSASSSLTNLLEKSSSLNKSANCNKVRSKRATSSKPEPSNTRYDFLREQEVEENSRSRLGPAAERSHKFDFLREQHGNLFSEDLFRNEIHNLSESFDPSEALRQKYHRVNRIFYNGALANQPNVYGSSDHQAHAAELLSFLKSLWATNTMCDLAITIGDQKYFAHRLALALFSAKYKEEFQKQLEKNKETSGMYKIVLSSPYSTQFGLEACLKYLYTAEISINPANVEEILGTARELSIDNLVYLCNDYLNSFSIGDVLDFISNMFDRDGSDLIFYELYSYMMTHLDKISRTPEFYKASRGVVSALLGDSHLQVKNELEVFDAVMRWINYDKEGRANMLNECLKNVRFTQISPEDLVSKVESQLGLLEDEGIAKQLYNAFKHHALTFSQRGVIGLKPREEPRNLGLTGASVPDEFVRAIKELAGIAHELKKTKILHKSQEPVRSNLDPSRRTAEPEVYDHDGFITGKHQQDKNQFSKICVMTSSREPHNIGISKCFCSHNCNNNSSMIRAAEDKCHSRKPA